MTKRVGAIITAGGHKYELLHILSINNIKYVPITIHPYRTPNEPIKLKNVYRHIMSLKNVSFDIIICNGPGTCVLYCFIAYLLGCKIIYIESIARRNSLSLSGKILEYIAWKFIVQSEKLLTRKRLYHNFFMNE